MAFAFTVGVAVLVLLIAQFFFSLDGLAKIIEVSKVGFTVWRLSVFLLLIGAWPLLTVGYAQWVGLTAQQIASLKAYRWRMAGWLLVMEVLFCQTLWTDFIQILLSMGTGST
ncbi:MAG: hypothetical protein M0R33_16420 [Methylomonas sp.]|jgi:hypothetical protein|uniref:hypothetical protein n=1 Tax=Methylomonas sp. TaxID=418 RepID=UPI0025FEFD62|nr:hypothetical protein [Methylomonas sp.]MCK9608028.1 hypothetical protein [Methylomonas sp.]